MKRTLAVMILVVLGLALALGASAATSNVDLKDIKFKPANVTITVGDTVKWTNKEDVPHSVTSKPSQAESFDSNPTCTGATGCMAQNDTFTKQFTHVGTFSYYCRVHGAPSGTCNMCGTVTVKAAATPSPSHTPSPTPKTTVKPTSQPSTAPTSAPHTNAPPGTSVTPTPTPSGSPTPTPTGTDVALITASPFQFGSPIVADEPASGNGKGLLIGGIVAAVVLISGGGLLFYRFRRP